MLSRTVINFIYDNIQMFLQDCLSPQSNLEWFQIKLIYQGNDNLSSLPIEADFPMIHRWIKQLWNKS